MARPNPLRVGVLVVLLMSAPGLADEADDDLKVLRDNKVGTDDAGLREFFESREQLCGRGVLVLFVCRAGRGRHF